jgi:hypothetical protein
MLHDDFMSLSHPARSMIRMDEFIDWLMREETICDVGNPEVLELQNSIEFFSR